MEGCLDDDAEKRSKMKKKPLNVDGYCYTWMCLYQSHIHKRGKI